MAYVLGFFAADGYMIANKRGAHFIDFYSNDREILEKIRKIIASDHTITIRSRQNEHQKNSYRLQIGSKVWFKDLTKLGFVQNKSLVLRFPTVPVQYRSHFIRGYFDGDGCVSFGRYWVKNRKRWKIQMSTLFTSGSQFFLDGLRKAIAPFVRGGFFRKKKRGIDLAYSHRDAVALFRLMYNNVSSDLFLKRKYQTFLRAFHALGYEIAGVA